MQAEGGEKKWKTHRRYSARARLHCRPRGSLALKTLEETRIDPCPFIHFLWIPSLTRVFIVTVLGLV